MIHSYYEMGSDACFCHTLIFAQKGGKDKDIKAIVVIGKDNNQMILTVEGGQKNRILY